MKAKYVSLMVLGVILLNGCASMTRNPSPEDPLLMAEIPGLPDLGR